MIYQVCWMGPAIYLHFFLWYGINLRTDNHACTPTSLQKV